MTDFQHLFSPSLRRLAALFHEDGFAVRVVGGAVRDTLLGVPVKDIDIATTAEPEEMLQIAKRHGLKVIPTGLQHGTVTFVVDGDDFEVTTTRIDVEVDGRHAEVAWTRSFEEDAARRDFTINAMSVDMEGNLYDYFGGVDDLKDGLVRFVGDARERIQEDYLRILRFFRFIGKFPEPPERLDVDAMSAILVELSGLQKISGERIWAELSKIIKGDHCETILIEMAQMGVLYEFGIVTSDREISHLGKIHGRGECGHALGLATLMSSMDAPSRKKVEERLRLSNIEVNMVEAILLHRDTNFSTDDWKRRIVLDKIPPSILINVAIFNEVENDIIMKVKAWETPHFPISGQDLIDRGMQPGPALGEVLRKLRGMWFEGGFVTITSDQIDQVINCVLIDN